MFCGILPWTWFASSLTESAGVLISGGNLIKKVLFPPRSCRSSPCWRTWSISSSGLVILAGFLLYYRGR